MPPLNLIGFVALGGAVGSMVRYGADLALPTQSGAFPWATFLVNVVGALLIGMVVGRFTRASVLGHDLPAWVRPLVVTGFLGGLTTFSTWMVESVQLLQLGELRAGAIAALYLFGSVLLGVIAVRVGLRLVEPPPAGDTSSEAQADIG